MKISIITLFPEVFCGLTSEGIISRAIRDRLIDVEVINLRDFTDDNRKTVDSPPYGGGSGMLMSVEPLFRAIDFIKNKHHTKNSVVILTSPRGEILNQNIVEEFSKFDHMILVCGHYEGVDERISKFIDREISIGDYVLTSGNLPAMVIVNSVTRLIPGVFGNDKPYLEDSFNVDGILLEYPQYTNPVEFMGMKVPDVLLSGNHNKIKEWKLEQSRCITKNRRPDIYEKYLSKNNKK